MPHKLPVQVRCPVGPPDRLAFAICDRLKLPRPIDDALSLARAYPSQLIAVR